jgi:hypothetical protein
MIEANLRIVHINIDKAVESFLYQLCRNTTRYSYDYSNGTAGAAQRSPLTNPVKKEFNLSHRVLTSGIEHTER